MDQAAIKQGLPGPKVSEAAISAGAPPSGANGTPGETPAAVGKTQKQPKHPLRQILEALADLRITVVLFALAIVLVFWGTLAQVDNGVWTVVQKYFRNWFVWVPLKVALFNSVEASDLFIPFPGGWLIGGVMLVNLLAAHAIRFRLTWNRAGILLIHAGIIVMMLGEFVTGMYAVEGQIRLRVGETGNTVIDSRHSELAISETLDAKHDSVALVPARLLRDGAEITNDKLPFKIEVIHFMINSSLRNAPNNNQATKGIGTSAIAVDMPEVSGVETGQMIDTPSVYVKLSKHDGTPLGTWLFSTRLGDPQWVEVDGKQYRVELRFKQTTRDFTMHLTSFDHKVFPGDPNKTKDYRSHIHLVDKANHVDKDDVQIYMNAPLYYRGETFYQSGMDRDERGVITTTLQVVRNPGWLMPYISCLIVGIGLLFHFGLTLYRFIDRRTVR